MRIAVAVCLSEPLEGQKLALRRFSFRGELASGLRALQPANTNGENPWAYDECASESCFWTSKDATLFATGILNVYVYAENDPVNLIDLNGLDDSDADCAQEVKNVCHTYCWGACSQFCANVCTDIAIHWICTKRKKKPNTCTCFCNRPTGTVVYQNQTALTCAALCGVDPWTCN
jgi:hypothetical protein